jgi:death-on-curing family protein
MSLSTLSVEDVLHIHRRVCEDFAETDDPVGFGGPRDGGALLESAVSRQHTGFGDKLKYPDPYTNAATLTFGLCCGHPFNNGNKRTALVAMLAHLDANSHAVFGLNQKELYSMIKAVATHELGLRPPPRRRKNAEYTPREMDKEVGEIAKWLEAQARKIKRGEQRITYKQLKQILDSHGYKLRKPKGNSIGIYREVTVRKPPLLKKVTMLQHVHTIGWPGERKIVPVKEIKAVRRHCNLDETKGSDANTFYAGADKIEPFINEYRTVLSRLSKE